MSKEYWKPGNMLYPVPAVMVSCGREGEIPNIITVAWAGTICSDPAMVSISVRKERFSHSIIRDTGEFVINLVNKRLVRATDYCGVKSGRDVDKFADLQMPKDCNDIPYMGWNACAVISGKVVEQHDLGTHTLFIAEVVDAKLINENAPLTYADYQTKVKPKAEPKAQDKKIVGWRCRICNYVYEGSELPADFTCPICGHGVEDFEPVYEA